MKKPRILVWASGSAEGGGSGFENLVNWSRWGYAYEVVAVISNYEQGGVRTRADRLGIPFHFFPGPFTLHGYQEIQEKLAQYNAKLHALSGWIKCFLGDEGMRGRVINIHPAPLPGFGGPGMWGHHVHEAVIAAYRRHEISHSAVSMHFVTWKADAAGNPDPNFYDAGPCFFRYPVEIRPRWTAARLAKAVNDMEHVWQPYVTELVAGDRISWLQGSGMPWLPEGCGTLFSNFKHNIPWAPA